MKRYDKIAPVLYGGNETYTWSNANVCFGNPLDIPEAIRKRKRKAKEAARLKEQSEGRRRDYKNMHG
jgi:hypothetical protein